jgi:signal transduction histidine kinase
MESFPADEKSYGTASWFQMEPLVPSSRFGDRYREALQAYLNQPGAPKLRQAGELGRDALGSGLGLAVLSAIHHESVSRILASQEVESALAEASNFLAESMSAFEISYRELRQSNTALRYRNRKLEQQVSQLSRLVFDEAIQLVAAVAMSISRLDRSLPGHIRNLDEAQGLLDRLAEQLTACTYDLHPRVLEDLGLRAAIESLCRRYSNTAQIDVLADTASGRLQPDARIAVYRAVQEALDNIASHARASHIEIRLTGEDGGIQCSVRDNGVGFDSSGLFSESAQQGLGLMAAREGLRAVGGTLSVQSRPGGGTEVAITIGDLMEPGVAA